MKLFRLEDDVATVIDSNYAYINTFITFLARIVDIINTMTNNAIEALGKLFNTLPKEE